MTNSIAAKQTNQFDQRNGPDATKEQTAMAALRGAVHFSGELLSIVESNLPPHLFTRTQIAVKLQNDKGDAGLYRLLKAWLMTNTELREWIKRHRLTHVKAAEILAMSLDGLHKNIYGITLISAQTMRIIELYDKLTHDDAV